MMLSHTKYTADELRNHFNRWMAIRDRLPIGYITLVEPLLVDRVVPPGRIRKVAEGQGWDFPILEALEQVVMAEEARRAKRQKIRLIA